MTFFSNVLVIFFVRTEPNAEQIRAPTLNEYPIMSFAN